MRRTIGFTFCVSLGIFILFSSVAPRTVVAVNRKQKSAPVGGNILPDGFHITPTAAPGSTFQGLPTGLRTDGTADANGAVTTALSPDGTALLILTTGYNTFFNNTDGTLITHPVLNPTTGDPTTTMTPNAEWIFVYDVRGPQPVQKQRINLPDTYHGLVWGPKGTRFYVSAGIDDRIYVYKASTTGPSADATFVPDAPFVLLGHNSNQAQPLPTYDGGILKNTAVNGPIGRGMFITPFSALAAGLALSPDGSTLSVANFQNDSLSTVDTQTRQVTKEVTFFQPGQTEAVGEMPYWPVVLSDSKGSPLKTYVTSMRDGQVLS